jgi:Ran GTPase-activating protein (RanGAP) involved in mRNA processing and transport
MRRMEGAVEIAVENARKKGLSPPRCGPLEVHEARDSLYVQVSSMRASQCSKVVPALHDLPRLMRVAHLPLTIAVDRSCQLANWQCSMLTDGMRGDASRCVSLNLRHNPIGKEGVLTLAAALRAHRSLKAIHLYGCGVDDMGAAALGASLGPASSLKYIDLGANEIGAPGAELLANGLARMASGLSVVMDENPLYDAGAAAFARAVRSGALDDLSLQDCFVRDEGANALSNALASEGCALQALNLGNNGFGPVGGRKLAAALPDSLRRLIVNGRTTVFPIPDLKNVAALARRAERLPHLTTLSLALLCGRDEAARTGIGAMLGSSRSLTDLNVSRMLLYDSGAAALARGLARSESILFMDCSHNYIRFEGALALAKAVEANRSLRHLVMYGNTTNKELRAACASKGVESH